MTHAGSMTRTALTCALLATAALTAPGAHADDPSWNGWYKITFHTDQKTGTSMAAGQPETPYTASYQFTTDCSSGTCEAKSVDGPAPKDNVAPTVSLQWTGTQWEKARDWRWDCLMPDRTIIYDQAHTVTTYVRQPDGSLTGSIATTIDAGACKGTVIIPVTARPA